MNFAGTIDWAVDLQIFDEPDKRVPADRPASGEGCVQGEDLTPTLRSFASFLRLRGFAQNLCVCTRKGELKPLPSRNKGLNVANIIAWDEEDVDLNRLCRFACKYGYCPSSVCTSPSTGLDPGDAVFDLNYINIGDERMKMDQYCYLGDHMQGWDVA